MTLVHRSVVVCLLVLATGHGPAARAQGVPAASGSDPVLLAAARRVLKFSGTVDAMVAAIRANLPAQQASHPDIAPEFWTRFEARVVHDAPQLVDSIAVIYAQSFSQQELEVLADFYGSPVGQRLRELQPTLIAESSAIGQRWGARIGAEIGASLPRR